MLFKINISDKGKSLKVETESESLIRSKIGDKIKGESFSSDLEGYELEITGTSDLSGFPGIKGQVGSHLRKVLLKKEDKGMNNSRKGLRLKKNLRGEEISEKTSQINLIVIKEGKKKFAELLPKKEEAKPAEGEEASKETESTPEEPKASETPERPAEDQEQAAPKEEPKPSKEEKQESDPEKEPKAGEAEKKELANPDQEPKS